MYHIANDKRARASAGLVLDALEECLKQKNYDLITITDVCRVSTVSRATFYRLFDNMDDVLAYKIELFEEEFESEIEGKDIREIMESFLSRWMEHPEALDILIHIHREDILYECHRKRAENISRHFLKTEVTEFHISILTQILISVLTTWARNGKKETPAEMVDILQKVLNDLQRQIKI